MGFWSLFLVASTPTFQVLLIALLGAFLASGYCNILTTNARKDINKVVFTVFTPALIFASLAKTVTLNDIISLWFMPVNVGIVVFLGAFLGWIVVKILRPEPHLEGLVIAYCSAGNFGNMLLIVIPAICLEDGNPFGSHSICRAHGLSYVSFSMAIGGFYIWTHTYGIMKKAAKSYHKIHPVGNGALEASDKNSDSSAEVQGLKTEGKEADNSDPSAEVHGPKTEGEDTYYDPEKQMVEASENHIIVPLLSSTYLIDKELNLYERLKRNLRHIAEELMAPATVAAIIGFIVGAIPWLKHLIIGASAPLRVIQDSIELLGDGTIPSITLILGGNLTQGLRKSVMKPGVIVSIICVRYVIMPVIGIGIVRAANELGLLAHDPLYSFILMIQFTLPPAMNIGTIAQLFDMGQEECSVVFLWTYLVAALALTGWSTVFMWILS